jgi:hypothetical protein
MQRIVGNFTKRSCSKNNDHCCIDGRGPEDHISKAYREAEGKTSISLMSMISHCLLQPSHLEIVNESFMHSVPKGTSRTCSGHIGVHVQEEIVIKKNVIARNYRFLLLIL